MLYLLTALIGFLVGVQIGLNWDWIETDANAEYRARLDKSSWSANCWRIDKRLRILGHWTPFWYQYDDTRYNKMAAESALDEYRNGDREPHRNEKYVY